ncbi:MAG: histidinol-phosphate transaminase [Pseudomonadota bacterium]
MTTIAALARPEVRALKAYVPAQYAEGAVRLNANESAERAVGDDTPQGMNRYPEARPLALTQTLAKHFGVSEERTFVTRGSSEAIDLLIRCFCRPGIDQIVICPPTFGMYSVYANLQGAGVKSIPLLADQQFALPVEQIVDEWSGTDRLVFVTSPNNPTGNAQPTSRVSQLAQSLSGRGVVVVDAAYAEFADEDLVTPLLAHDNVIVLRTLSKAYGLAGLRCGAALGCPDAIELLSKAMPPYAVPTPSTAVALAAMADSALTGMPDRIAQVRQERERIAEQLSKLTLVRNIYPSDANFLLVQFDNAEQVLSRCAAAGLLLRDFTQSPFTPGAIRISIGTPTINDQLIETLCQIEHSVTLSEVAP